MTPALVIFDCDGTLVDSEPISIKVLVEMLAASERAPRNQLVHVGVAGVVADFFRFEAGPDR